jgi:hypothetical protein
LIDIRPLLATEAARETYIILICMLLKSLPEPARPCVSSFMLPNVMSFGWMNAFRVRKPSEAAAKPTSSPWCSMPPQGAARM